MRPDLPPPGGGRRGTQADASTLSPLAGTADAGPTQASGEDAAMLAIPDLFDVLDHLGDAVVILDHEYRIVAHNAAAERLVGRPTVNLAATPLWDMWPSPTGDTFAEHLRRAMSDRLSLHTEHHILDDSAADVWLDVHILPTESGLTVVARDITAHRRAERTRREERAKQLQELTAALSAALDPESVGAAIIERAMPALGANAGNVFLVDTTARELRSVAVLGYEPEIAQWARRLPLDGPTLVAEVARTGAPVFLSTWEERIARYPHHRHVHARGGDRAVAGLPLKVEGRTIGALSLAFPSDRTFEDDDRRFMATVADLCSQALERARLYEAVRLSEERFHQLADAIPQIAWVMSGDGTTLEYLNKRWLDYTGVAVTSGPATLANEPIHPDDWSAVSERWVDAFRSGESFESELRLRAADGTYRWFLSRSAPVCDATGKIVKWFGTSTDIDDAKRVEENQRFLAELGQTLASSLDPEETLRRVTRLVVSELADYCFADLIQADGQIRRVAWTHVDPDEQRIFDERLVQYLPVRLHPEHPISRTLETGEPQFVPNVTGSWLKRIAFSPEHLEFMRGRNFRSQMTVPLRARDRTLGALTFCMTGASGRRFVPENLAFARELAERVALAVDNARLYTEARDAEAKVRRLLDAGVVGVTVTDDHHILEANDHFLDMVGHTREELNGGRLSWRDMTPLEYVELDARATAELAEQGVCSPFEKEYIRRDGS